MNVQLTRDKIKDNPFAMLAIMAGIAAVTDLYDSLHKHPASKP